MKEYQRLEQGRTFAYLLCVIACLFVNWPILGIFVDRGGLVLIASLFVIWLLIISCLFFYCRYESAGLPEMVDDQVRP
jgi:hypothetical protein